MLPLFGIDVADGRVDGRSNVQTGVEDGAVINVGVGMLMRGGMVEVGVTVAEVEEVLETPSAIVYNA